MSPIPGLPGCYATADGRILSNRSGELIELRQRDCDGYMHVTVAVYRGRVRERHRHSVHRLVLMAFKGVPEKNANHGRHLDGDSRNNALDNLEWGTARENAADAVRHGTLGKGMAAHRRKLTAEQVQEIRRRLADGEQDAALAKEFRVSRYYPTKLVQERRWTHL